jgi:hypothetical protein
MWKSSIKTHRGFEEIHYPREEPACDLVIDPDLVAKAGQQRQPDRAGAAPGQPSAAGAEIAELGRPEIRRFLDFWELLDGTRL